MSDLAGKPEDSIIPVDLSHAGEFTFGTAMGIASGYILRQGGKVALAATGTAFCLVQGLAYLGYVKVNWNAVERDYMRLLDTDGDGKVTSSDATLQLQRVEKILSSNLPSGSGFSSGLAYAMTGSVRAAAVMGAAWGLGGTFAAVSTGTQEEIVKLIPSTLQDMLPDSLKANWKPSTVPQSMVQDTAEASKLAFNDSIMKKSLEELREIEKDYNSMLLVVGKSGPAADNIKDCLDAIEQAKVEVKKRR